MITSVSELFANYDFERFQFFLGILLTIAFLVLFFGKTGKDERGRGIMGTASFFAIIALIIVLNIGSFYSKFLIQSEEIVLGAMQLLYNIFLLVIALCNLILRKFR